MSGVFALLPPPPGANSNDILIKTIIVQIVLLIKWSMPPCAGSDYPK